MQSAWWLWAENGTWNYDWNRKRGLNRLFEDFTVSTLFIAMIFKSKKVKNLSGTLLNVIDAILLSGVILVQEKMTNIIIHLD